VCDPASAEGTWGFVSMMAQPDGVEGLFGPSVVVPPDAPKLDRILGLSGRDPGWRP
jgi:hypothetical protein